MQADEDVGKIALAVPVLVSKALELFLQDLCDRTYNITLQRGVKTMSSLHLKQCVNSFNVFDFLRDIVSKVPDLGTSDAGAEDRSSKKRKAADEDNDSDEESKRSKIETAGHGGSARGRGRGRGRGRAGRGNRGTERDGIHNDKCEDDPGTSPQHDDQSQHPKPETVVEGFATEQKETAVSNNNTGGIVRNFDLNLDLDEIGDSDAAVASVPSSMEKHKMKHEEYPGWSLTEMNKMGIDPLHLALSSRRIDEEEEDYDNEEG